MNSTQAPKRMGFAEFAIGLLPTCVTAGLVVVKSNQGHLSHDQGALIAAAVVIGGITLWITVRTILAKLNVIAPLLTGPDESAS